MSSGGLQTDAERKETYYLRTQLLVVNLGTDILRSYFDYKVPPTDLNTELNKNYQKIATGEKKGYISRQQCNILLRNSTPPKSKDFDVSLLCYLLRNICGIRTKGNWWKEVDNSKIPDTEQSVEADIVRIRNMRNTMQHKQVASLEDTEFQEIWDTMEKAMCRLAAQCNFQNMKIKIDEQKTAQLDVVSEQYNSLRVNSEYFLRDFFDESCYVETDAYKKAKQILEDQQMVVLTGYPGEGKTTMAARLALTFSHPRNCLKLSSPSDWRLIDLNLKLAGTIIIDDIFGAGTLDQRLVGEWSQWLPEIKKAAEEKTIRVIITSRHYILKESLKEIRTSSISLFREESKRVVLLSSDDLTEDEKSKILKIQSMRNEREMTDQLVRECVKASQGPTEENPDFLFGFPECASMFVRSKGIYNQGAVFFRKPSSHFKSYLEDLYRREEEKYLALVAVWVKENKRLSLTELQNSKTVSDDIRHVAEVFDYDINKKFLDTLKIALKSHDGDYLVFDERSQEYSFSHNVIGDMVGLVVGKERLVEAVKLCPRDFLMEYVSVDKSANEEFKLVVNEIYFKDLAEKCVDMLLRRNCNSNAEAPNTDEFYELRGTRRRKNDVETYNKIDYGIIKHRAFTCLTFVTCFIDFVQQNNLVEQVFHEPVLKMKGYFLHYGISMKDFKMCLLGYAWFSGVVTLAKEVITREILGSRNFDPSVSLLLATHSEESESVDFLLSHGAKVTGDVIYIAMHQKSMSLLQKILQHPGTDVNDRGNAVNGNYPLIIAARKGFSDAVKCLLRNGADPGVKNSFNLTALHKAILYKQKPVTDLLIEAHAPLDIKGGKFKRTPLHLAADKGYQGIARKLVEKGAKLKIKDHRRHYPVHIAAIRGHVSVVRILLAADPTQDKWRISSYGRKSMIKGMSLYHIAVWKRNYKLLDALIQMEADPNVLDFYGQTPLYYAISRTEEKCIERLLSFVKTDKKKPQKKGFTPLHAAIYKGLTKVALQLAPESDVNARDKYGRTPLHVACEKDNLLVVYRLVRDFNADFRIATKRRDTVFHILRRKCVSSKSYSRHIELFLMDSDKEFAKTLPDLKNTKGIAIRSRTSGSTFNHAELEKIISKLTSDLETPPKDLDNDQKPAKIKSPGSLVSDDNSSTYDDRDDVDNADSMYDDDDLDSDDDNGLDSDDDDDLNSDDDNGLDSDDDNGLDSDDDCPLYEDTDDDDDLDDNMYDEDDTSDDLY